LSSLFKNKSLNITSKIDELNAAVSQLLENLNLDLNEELKTIYLELKDVGSELDNNLLSISKITTNIKQYNIQKFNSQSIIQEFDDIVRICEMDNKILYEFLNDVDISNEICSYGIDIEKIKLELINDSNSVEEDV
jgi:hypothetical protein